MPDYEAIEVLTQAKERIFDQGWGKGTTYTRELRDDWQSLCLEEGVCGQRGDYIPTHRECVTTRAGRYLKDVLHLSDKAELFLWNDRQESAGPVFDAIDDA